MRSERSRQPRAAASAGVLLLAYLLLALAWASPWALAAVVVLLWLLVGRRGARWVIRRLRSPADPERADARAEVYTDELMRGFVLTMVCTAVVGILMGLWPSVVPDELLGLTVLAGLTVLVGTAVLRVRGLEPAVRAWTPPSWPAALVVVATVAVVVALVLALAGTVPPGTALGRAGKFVSLVALMSYARSRLLSGALRSGAETAP